jgi:hypothetical protein
MRHTTRLSLRSGVILAALLGLGALPLPFSGSLSSFLPVAQTAWAESPAVQINEVPERGMLSGSATIDGRVGGYLKVGRWTLRVPPGAFATTATVTLTVPNASKMVCELEISPASANNFLVPVSLTAYGAGGNVPASQLRLFWFDPASESWVGITGFTNPLTSSVTAPLWHFSTYAQGKAGW